MVGPPNPNLSQVSCAHEPRVHVGSVSRFWFARRPCTESIALGRTRRSGSTQATTASPPQARSSGGAGLCCMMGSCHTSGTDVAFHCHDRYVVDPLNAPWESIALQAKGGWPIEAELRVKGDFSHARKPLPLTHFDSKIRDVNERLDDAGAPRLLEEVRVLIEMSDNAHTCAACPLHRVAGVYRRQNVHWAHVHALQLGVAHRGAQREPHHLGRWAADVHDLASRDKLRHREARQARQGGEGLSRSRRSSFTPAARGGK